MSKTYAVTLSNICVTTFAETEEFLGTYQVGNYCVNVEIEDE